MEQLNKTKGYKVIQKWLASKAMKPFQFQEEAWQQIHLGNSGLVNAPTGFGKTFSVFLGSLINFIDQHPTDYKTKKKNGLQLLWITPLRALGKDIARAMEEVIAELGMSWQIGIRNGDTDVNERQRQKRNMPEALIITPESLHLLLAQKGYREIFSTIKIVAVDEWHELLGSKRGVQVELAISRIVGLKKAIVDRSEEAEELSENSKVKGKKSKVAVADSALQVWGISATIGNLEQARDVLLAPLQKLLPTSNHTAFSFSIIKANLRKNVEIVSVLPDEIEKFPWAGHLGLNLAEKAIDIIRSNTTTLMFINTRGMSERWYQTLLTLAPDLAGAIALHHGSIEQELRIWVEEALHTTRLKVVVCTASLDLGVDFRPVETVIQVGSPKGVARFLQRAGRSGHQPGKVSKIYFLPTHSLELVEAAALKQAMEENLIENREPRLLCFDVLIQYLCTLSIGEGFRADEIFDEVKTTYSFGEMTREEFDQLVNSIVNGGVALQQYDEYKKVEIGDDIAHIAGSYFIFRRHRQF
jgi:ATP-dependent Lhr-like helicase